jgi:hypothetical protein
MKRSVIYGGVVLLVAWSIYASLQLRWLQARVDKLEHYYERDLVRKADLTDFKAELLRPKIQPLAKNSRK